MNSSPPGSPIAGLTKAAPLPVRWTDPVGDGIGHLSLTSEPRVLERCAKDALPDPERADTAPVVRIPGLFNPDEVKELRAVLRRLAPAAHAARGSHAGGIWSTAYVHTDGALARELSPSLWGRLVSALDAADASVWRILRGVRRMNGLPCGIRTAEYHRYIAGGGLEDPGHFDGGSILTLDVMLSDGFDGGKTINMAGH